ncbi:hypothetical protein ACFSHT_20290 [Paraburkholderia silviterrae]|uniref:Uncharacterized protein n=1 Tax=Paraburkholderia silviterrae TaxID=2528715 RepID=A0A4R5M5N2_9BURK|nr:hypothetical protein [Paraburkholderia silviterrae]TDG20777.1 hypothetical protein EYW47_24895 [Paraburkholderia silviterrae]
MRFFRLIASRDVFALALYFVMLAALLYAFGGSTLSPLIGTLPDAHWRPAIKTREPHELDSSNRPHWHDGVRPIATDSNR